MEQIQNYFKDNGSSVKGFSSVFSQMFSDLDTLRSKPSDKTVRNQFISSAQSLCTYFNQMSDNLSKLQDDCNEEIRNNVDKINSISEKISLLNKEINQIETGTGVEASSLRDERANLIDSLSKIVNVSYNETEVQNTNGDNLGGTNFSLYINGEKVVEGKDYRKLICESSKTKNNQTDNDDLYKIYWEDTKMEFSATAGTAGGSLKALFEVRDGDNLENFFIRITAHNKFFGNVPYQMVGFAYNSLHEFCAVLIQPHIKAEREATENEIADYMQALGFEMDYLDEFHNDQYEVFDAVPNNVLYGIDRELYFIDTQIRLKK